MKKGAKVEKYLRPIRNMVQSQLASMFIVCLGVLFALLHFVGTIEDDARFINEAGRLRTYVPLVTKSIYHEQLYGNSSSGHLAFHLDNWLATHKMLQEGNSFEDSNLFNSQQLDSIYDRISSYQAKIIALTVHQDVSPQILQDSLPFWESQYLTGMDFIVDSYQEQYETDLTNFRLFTVSGMVLLLVVGLLCYQYLLAPIYLNFRKIFSKLQRSESRLLEAQEISKMGNWQWDMVFDEITWSDQLYGVFGQKKGDYEANYGNLMKLIHPDDREAFNFDVERAIEEKVDHDIIHRIIINGGEIRYVHQKGRAFYDKNGKPVRMAGTTIDVTEQMVAQQKIVNQNKELQNFIHVISHNLRRPVANILGLHEIYEPGNHVQNDEVIEHIRVSCETLDTTIRDLNHSLSLRQLKSEEFEEVDLEEVIQDVFTLLVVDIAEVKAQLNVQLQVKRMPGVKSYYVNILYNLVLNAIKYAKPGISPEILICTKELFGGFVLEVHDNGKGMRMTPESRKKIFDMYGRLSGDSEGKGLGLYLVKTQIEAMQGQIQVSSALGEGTQFHIRIPKSTIEMRDFDSMKPTFASPQQPV